MGEKSKWPQALNGGNKYFIHTGGWNKYNIDIELNISRLSWGEKTLKAFNLSCEKKWPGKNSRPPPRYRIMVAPLAYLKSYPYLFLLMT